MAAGRILLSAGDASGDMHAANLMEAMRRMEPDLEFVGFGMDRMAEAGLQPLGEETTGDGAMWLRNLLRVGHYRRRLRACADYLRRRPPHLVLPVDFGGFNLCLCRLAARRGIPVYYHIPPQVWAHGRYRLKKLRKWTTRCGLIYPFEPDLYRRGGVEFDYVGHPLFDELERRRPAEGAKGLLERHGTNLVGIFPGSRTQEVEANLPVMAEACRRIRRRLPEARFCALTLPPLRPAVERSLARAGVQMEVARGVDTLELARASRICITKSGTVTLEIASQETPMVIYYRASPLVLFLGRGLIHTPHIGLINSLAGRRICPEMPSARARPDWIAREALRLLTDHESHRRCAESIAGVLEGYAEPGASRRAARGALSLLQ